MARRLIFWFLVFIFVLVLITRFTQISKLAQTLSTGHWGWVIAAAFLQLGFYIVYTGLYEVVFATVHVHRRLWELVPVVFASVFVNVAVPTGGASGLALYLDDAAKHGQSPARAAAGVLLVLIVDFSSFVILLGLGLAHLALSGQLHTYELTAAAILLAIILSMSAALLLGLWRPSVLLHMLLFIQRLVNRMGRWIKRPEIIPENWAATHAMDFSAASIAIAENPLRLGRALGTALIAHGVNLASLYTLFLAFYRPIDIGTLVAGYAMGNLFWIVSITPQGVGVVEGVMSLVFAGLRVPVDKCAVIVLAYRGLGFWLPLIIGFFMLQRVRSFTGRDYTQVDNEGQRREEDE